MPHSGFLMHDCTTKFSRNLFKFHVFFLVNSLEQVSCKAIPANKTANLSIKINDLNRQAQSYNVSMTADQLALILAGLLGFLFAKILQLIFSFQN